MAAGGRRRVKNNTKGVLARVGFDEDAIMERFDAGAMPDDDVRALVGPDPAKRLSRERYVPGFGQHGKARFRGEATSGEAHVEGLRDQFLLVPRGKDHADQALLYKDLGATRRLREERGERLQLPQPGDMLRIRSTVDGSERMVRIQSVSTPRKLTATAVVVFDEPLPTVPEPSEVDVDVTLARLRAAEAVGDAPPP
jgi:hypothetical protein